tara:strand:- start:1189 stop:1461 length:273 start_codon:yes stop_codon:yes gene_type:complete
MASAASDAGPQEPPLNPVIIRNLSDKLYEKRKLGALEIEQTVKGLDITKDRPTLASIVEYITENFINSPNANHRKGIICSFPQFFSNYFL